MLKSTVFKAYDIRGVYGVDWDADGAARIVRAFVEVFKIKQLVLGWDMRVSSPEMVAKIREATLAAGVRLITVGEVTTPVLYFGTAGYEGNDAGIIVTASHNTGEWNGMKLLLGSGMPVGEASGLPDIKARALDAASFIDSPTLGTIEHREILDDCYKKIFSVVQIHPTAPLSIVVDCGNGMAGAAIHQLLARIPTITAHVMYDTPDGAFPNHEANPLKEETLDALKHEVITRRAAVGFAYDGDADRIGFVDEQGNMVGADVMFGIIGLELLKTHPGAMCMFDLRSRRAAPRLLEAAGGHTHMSRVGHAFIKKQMRETGALFAAELSSHFYFQEYFGVECADLTLLYVIKILQESGRPLSEHAREFLTDSHSGEINFKVADRDGAIAKLEAAFGGQALNVSKIDGLLCEMGDWWFNVRPSNTEPLLRLCAEARSPEKLQEKVREITSIII